MKTRNILILILGLIILGLVIFFALDGNKTEQENLEGINQIVEERNGRTLPVFSWSFDEDESLNLDGFNKTNVYLEAKYSDETVQRKLIDTLDGGCSVLPETESDSVAGSTNVQCYYAGLGYKFKITKGDDSYEVERKSFEEGSLDSKPKDTNYEVVSEFTF